MLNSSTRKKSSASLEISDNVFVCLFDILALVVCNHWCELSILIYWYRSVSRLNQTICDTGLIIIITETWCLVDNACTCVG